MTFASAAGGAGAGTDGGATGTGGGVGAGLTGIFCSTSGSGSLGSIFAVST